MVTSTLPEFDLLISNFTSYMDTELGHMSIPIRNEKRDRSLCFFNILMIAYKQSSSVASYKCSIGKRRKLIPAESILHR